MAGKIGVVQRIKRARQENILKIQGQRWWGTECLYRLTWWREITILEISLECDIYGWGGEISNHIWISEPDDLWVAALFIALALCTEVGGEISERNRPT